MSGVLVNPPCEDETGLISVLDLDLKGDNALGMVLQSSLPVAASTIRRHVHIYAEGEGLESNSYETIKKYPSRTEEEPRTLLAATPSWAHCSCIPAKIRCHGAAL